MVEQAFSVLNMRSIKEGPEVTRSDPDDLTTRARIRDAAIARFATDGVGRTTIRSIATDAGVSPGLVIHHFGSKAGLRAECDRHVASFLRERKSEAMRSGPRLDPLGAMRSAHDGPPVMRYLAMTLVESSPELDAMVDTIVSDAAGYMEEGVESGILEPTDHPFERAAVVTLYSLGMLALHEHLERLLGVDIFGDPAGMQVYLEVASEIVVSGIGTDELAEMLAHTFAREGNET